MFSSVQNDLWLPPPLESSEYGSHTKGLCDSMAIRTADHDALIKDFQHGAKVLLMKDFFEEVASLGIGKDERTKLRKHPYVKDAEDLWFTLEEAVSKLKKKNFYKDRKDQLVTDTCAENPFVELEHKIQGVLVGNTKEQQYCIFHNDTPTWIDGDTEDLEYSECACRRSYYPVCKYQQSDFENKLPEEAFRTKVYSRFGIKLSVTQDAEGRDFYFVLCDVAVNAIEDRDNIVFEPFCFFDTPNMLMHRLEYLRRQLAELLEAHRDFKSDEINRNTIVNAFPYGEAFHKYLERPKKTVREVEFCKELKTVIREFGRYYPDDADVTAVAKIACNDSDTDSDPDAEPLNMDDMLLSELDFTGFTNMQEFLFFVDDFLRSLREKIANPSVPMRYENALRS